LAKPNHAVVARFDRLDSGFENEQRSRKRIDYTFDISSPGHQYPKSAGSRAQIRVCAVMASSALAPECLLNADVRSRSSARCARAPRASIPVHVNIARRNR
jgi:hypothetical protein